MRTRLRVLLCFTVFTFTSFSAERSLVSLSNANNRALLISAANGLMGLDLDIKNVQEIAYHPAFAFKDKTLVDDEASVPNAEQALADLAKDVGENGTLFFYFTGHGTKGGLYMGDQNFLHVSDMKAAIEAGRKGMGPVERLVIMYDSCFSGSMVDPVRNLIRFDENEMLADSIVSAFSQRDAGNYWKKLFVFASSREDETSLASADGSIFTLALKKAFDETLAAKGTMGQLAELTKKYTEGHHPVERFVPASMASEKLVN